MSNIIDGLINRSKEKVVKNIRIPEVGEIRIKELSNEEFENVYKKCQKINQSTKQVEVDSTKLMNLICVESIIDPDLKLLDNIKRIPGASKPEDLLNAIFKPGEKTKIFEKIQEISGFGIDINEEIEEIKK